MNSIDQSFELPLSPANFETRFVDVRANSIDALVEAGVRNILATGHRVAVRAGEALQAYGVNYILSDPLNRLHLTRAGAVRYLCREFLAYFSGSLRVADGLSHAAPFWESLQDKDGRINSNYGHYVFYEPVEGYGSQYNWIIQRLSENLDSRRAIININQNYHKSDTLDFPCTVAIQFYVRGGSLYCEVLSRSTDVVTGLPYDMGFFSFLHELVFNDLIERGIKGLRLGSTIIKASFTQIYDRTFNKAVSVTKKNAVIADDLILSMPPIQSASEVLADIYNGTTRTPVVAWITEHAN
ncbi:thymidylate synthase [Rhizobium miluonense]|jgi:thymidylate synthase|uniref:thymidylate synthase n=1 Tax=Rhizobium miluonense TaxID=411945 RepID=A0ABU1SX67_9HYPH|nr:thymidylate synthase [Rhizobium miluonense]MDR6903557.1 thymidylate synthase [Rhizobium miluonense]